MKKPILIIAPENDEHALDIAHMLEHEFNVSTIMWNSCNFPLRDSAGFSLNDDKCNFYLKRKDETISSEELHCIWWRRFRRYELDPHLSDPKVYSFCYRECDFFFRGAMDSLDVPIINTPRFEISAQYKPLQLKEASRSGLSIPNTLMSNDPVEIWDFWKQMKGNVIYKTFNSPSWQCIETRILTEEDLKHLDSLKHAPIIVQEKIEKGLDIRVNIFGDKVFAAFVKINHPSAVLDWRLDPTAIWQEVLLPDDISEKLIKLLRRLHLHYGCIDLRQQPDGSYVFLEVNPSGQFLFVEFSSGQELTRSFAEFLLDPHVEF